MKRQMGFAVGFLLVMSIAGCGGGDDASAAAPGDNPSTVSTDGATAPDSTDTGSDSAEVDLGGTTYEFSKGGCTLTAGDDLVSQFFNGDDALNVTAVNHDVLIRVTIDGQAWGNSDDNMPDVSDPGNITWSGELTKQGVQEAPVDATVTLHC